MPSSSRYATSAFAFVVLLGGGPASAQEVETGPRRAPAGVIAPADAERAGDADPARPLGAAPVPEQRGPLGEPAVPVVETTPSEAATATNESVSNEEEEEGLLGEPIAIPTRRSFLPAGRSTSQRGPVSALAPAWGLTGQAFVDEQLAHPRVVDAQLDAKFDLKALFAERGLAYPPRDLYFRLFKQEQTLEVWVRESPGAGTYTLLREYPICAMPGRLGPKTRVDDFQAPEGFYYIQGFNPESEFHLSLRLNYPNAADRIIGVTDSWGGDIYIHGGCSTVGCFPMTDEAMAELYWLAVEARGAGQAMIPVHVFPARLTDSNMRWLSATFSRDRRLVAFWENLREGYTYFEEHRRLPSISVDGGGRYLFADAGAAMPVMPIETGLVGEERPAVAAPLGAELPVEGAPLGDQAPTEDASPGEEAPLEEDAPLGAELPSSAR